MSDNDWNKSHKTAIDEKWSQCPPITTKIKELIKDSVCMGTYGIVEHHVMMLEKELAEARAEIERLKELYDSSLEMSAIRLKLANEKTLIISEKDAMIEQMVEALQSWISRPDLKLSDSIQMTNTVVEAWRLRNENQQN